MLSAFSAISALDTLPSTVFIKNEKLEFVYVNKAYEEMFGVSQAEMLGKTVLEVSHLP